MQKPDLDEWIARFDKDRRGAALDFWYEMQKGAHESLLEFQWTVSPETVAGRSAVALGAAVRSPTLQFAAAGR